MSILHLKDAIFIYLRSFKLKNLIYQESTKDAVHWRGASVQRHAQLAPVAGDHGQQRVFLHGGFAHQFDAAS
jgi:hypothetical protein